MRGHLVGSQEAPDVSPVHTAQTTTGAEERGRQELRHSRPEEGTKAPLGVETGLGSGCVVNMAKEAIYIQLEPDGWPALTYWAWLTPEEFLGKVDSSCTPERTKAYVWRSPVESSPYTSLDLPFQMVPRMQSCSVNQSSSSSQSAKPPCAVVWGSFPPSPLIVMSTRAREERAGLAHGEPGPSMGAVTGPRPPKLSCTVGARGTPQNIAPCSLVEQGRLGWADNGGPAGRSGRSSAAKKVKTPGCGGL